MSDIVAAAEHSREPKISIIIPCYNYSRYLSEAIESALAQDYPNLEVIVIDDGSTDGTKEEALKYKDRGVKYVYQPNQGVSSARNLGSSKAAGQYIMYLDADDKLEPHYVSSCLKVLQDNPDVSFVYTQMRYFGRVNEVSSFPDYSLAALKVGNYINASALIKAEVLQRFQYDTSLRSGFEDWDFYLTLAEHGYTGKLLDKPLLLYRKHEDHSSLVDALDRPKVSVGRRLNVRIYWRHWRLFGPAFVFKRAVRVALLTLSGR